MIPLTECKHRGLYKLESRNLSFGVFLEDSRGFIGIREKFSSKFLFTEYHWEIGPPHGTATPTEYLGIIPEFLIPEENNYLFFEWMRSYQSCQ